MSRSEPRALGARWFPRILLVTFLVQTAVYGLRPMVSYRALAVGAGPFELGLITSSFALLSLFVAIPIGRWVDRWGEPRFVVIGTVLVSIVAFALVFIDSVPALAVSQAALGLGHILNTVATQTLIANAGRAGQRDARFGAFTVVVSLGQLVGPAVAGLLAGSAIVSNAGASGTGAAFAFASVVALAACVVGVSLWRWPPPQSSPPTTTATDGRAGSREALGRVLRVPSLPQAMLASLTVLTSIDILAAYLPAYAEATGIGVETVGLLLAARAGASMASRLIMMPLIRGLGRRRLLAASMLAPAAGLLLMGATSVVPVLFALMILIGFGLGLGQPLTLAWVAARAPNGIRGTAIGVRLSGNRLGQFVLPAAVGTVAGAAGISAIFVTLAGLLVISTTLVISADFSDTAEPEHVS